MKYTHIDLLHQMKLKKEGLSSNEIAQTLSVKQDRRLPSSNKKEKEQDRLSMNPDSHDVLSTKALLVLLGDILKGLQKKRDMSAFSSKIMDKIEQELKEHDKYSEVAQHISNDFARARKIQEFAISPQDTKKQLQDNTNQAIKPKRNTRQINVTSR